jgi:ornithine cyclodeaminase/alanine dehydrogenase
MPVAIMDGVVISAQRTAALTAVAARYMARKDASSVAFLACGSQARSHLEALKAEFPLQRIVAYSRRATTAKAFAGFAEERGLKAEVATDPNQAIGAVDMVVSSVPHAATGGAFLDARRLAPGTFVSMVDLGYSWVASSSGALDRVLTDDIANSGPGHSEKRCYTPAYAADVAGLLLEQAAEQGEEFARNGYRLALIGRRRGLDAALARYGLAEPQTIEPESAQELRDFLAKTAT